MEHEIVANSPAFLFSGLAFLVSHSWEVTFKACSSWTLMKLVDVVQPLYVYMITQKQISLLQCMQELSALKLNSKGKF